MRFECIVYQGRMGHMSVLCVGGYKKSAMGIQPASFSAVPVHVVGVNGSITVHYDPHQKKWFCDQGGIVYTESPDF